MSNAATPVNHPKPPETPTTHRKEVAEMMTRIMLTAYVWLLPGFTNRRRDERGEAVPWLIVIGAGVAIAYFAGDSVMAFAKSLVGKLG
jgi:hypothetical protein